MRIKLYPRFQLGVCGMRIKMYPRFLLGGIHNLRFQLSEKWHEDQTGPQNLVR
jgi:hypothetical protein